MSFQTGVTNLYNEFVNKGVTPTSTSLSDMIDAVVSLYNKGKSDGVTVHSTTYSLSTKASAAASTYDMGASHSYRYINATAAWNKASSTGYASGTAAGSGSLINTTTYNITTTVALGSTATHTKAISCNKIIAYGIYYKSGGDDAVVNVSSSGKNIITKITYTYSKNIVLKMKVWYV